MKKVLFLLTIAILAVSCNRSEAVLFASKTQVNAQCPMVVDEITTLKNVVYDIGEPFFIYNYTINETICPMSAVKDQIETLAENVKSTIDVPANQVFLAACANANVKILYQYSGSESGEMCWITYDPNNKTTTVKRE